MTNGYLMWFPYATGWVAAAYLQPVSHVRVCVEAGCPELTTTTRCHDHERVRDQARGTRQARGYDSVYDAMRKADLALLAGGHVLVCWRCGGVVPPHDYSLGHCDDDRSVIHGPEHLRKCNLANTRGGCPHPAHMSHVT